MTNKKDLITLTDLINSMDLFTIVEGKCSKNVFEFVEPVYGYKSEEGKDIFEVEVPGLSKEDIKIEVQNKNIVVSFSRSLCDKPARKYKLQLSFPAIYLLKAEHINAEIKNGLLTIEIDLDKCNQSFVVPIKS